jgi:hypothetical protein
LKKESGRAPQLQAVTIHQPDSRAANSIEVPGPPGGFSEIFERYQRSEKALVAALTEM